MVDLGKERDDMATRSGTTRDVTPADRPAGVRRLSDAFVVGGRSASASS